eukprot:301004-Rhodomonas_salina.2
MRNLVQCAERRMGIGLECSPFHANGHGVGARSEEGRASILHREHPRVSAQPRRSKKRRRRRRRRRRMKEQEGGGEEGGMGKEEMGCGE